MVSIQHPCPRGRVQSLAWEALPCRTDETSLPLGCGCQSSIQGLAVGAQRTASLQEDPTVSQSPRSRNSG
eukprot:335875-Amphidinium_carterae.5